MKVRLCLKTSELVKQLHQTSLPYKLSVFVDHPFVFITNSTTTHHINMFSLCIASTLVIASNALCVWDGTGCFDDGCDPVKRQENCGKFASMDSCKNGADSGDNRCTWSEVAVGVEILFISIIPSVYRHDPEIANISF